jgi:Icc protein
LQGFQQPVVVICGHVHQEQSWQQRGVSVYSTPATALQFAPGQDNFQIDEGAAPGLRWLELRPQGTWKTRVERF